MLLGFFHGEHSLNSGGSDRIMLPPDFLGIAVGGPSREGFYFAPIYRLHGTETKSVERGPYIYPDSASHDWTFAYAPGTGGSDGAINVTFDRHQVNLSMPARHQSLGAHFNRFGLISTHTDGNGQHIYFDDLTYTWSQTE